MMLQHESNRPSMHVGPQHAEPGIIVETRDRTTFRFDDGWALTLEGVSGTADVSSSNERGIRTDTTLSYWEITSAAPARRDNTMRQFLLTILGVILVIGLAAIILYAAFIATDR